jgi:hypothetical protein
MLTKFAALRTRGVKLVGKGVAVVTAVAASAAHAVDDAAITTAQTAATNSVELTSTGLIQIVAVIVGVGLVISLLKKV